MDIFKRINELEEVEIVRNLYPPVAERPLELILFTCPQMRGSRRRNRIRVNESKTGLTTTYGEGVSENSLGRVRRAKGFVQTLTTAGVEVGKIINVVGTADYDRAFYNVLNNFEEIVPEELQTQWDNRLISHVGLGEKQKQERRALAKRVIASYAAEGIVFELLDKSGILPNPVWISFDEPPFAGETTEILRERKGLPPLTKIF